MSQFSEIHASVLSGSVNVIAQHVRANDGISTNASASVPGLTIYGVSGTAHAAMEFVEPTILTGAAVAGQAVAPATGANAIGYIQVQTTVAGVSTTRYVPFFDIAP